MNIEVKSFKSTTQGSTPETAASKRSYPRRIGQLWTSHPQRQTLLDVALTWTDVFGRRTRKDRRFWTSHPHGQMAMDLHGQTLLERSQHEDFAVQFDHTVRHANLQTPHVPRPEIRNSVVDR